MRRVTKSAGAPVISIVPLVGARRSGDTVHVSPARQDCVSQLRYLLREAEMGRVEGMAFAVMTSMKSYKVNAFGDAMENPTFSLGMIEVLKAFMIEQLNKH